jgi:hypothetical protein
LRTLLTTRAPVPGILTSTGSRRGDVAAPTNVFVASDSGVSDAQLRQRLLALAKQRGTGYAIVVRRTGSTLPSARGFGGFMAAMGASGMGGQAIPVAEAVKLYPDGREEPLRGAILSGITPAAFKNIVAASRSRAPATLSRGGAASGLWALVPRSFSRHLRLEQRATYVVPSLLFDDISMRAPRGDGVAPPIYGPPWISK